MEPPRNSHTGKGPLLEDDEDIQYRELFKKLDVNCDGKIDINDLTVALSQLHDHQLPGHAQRLLSNLERDGEGQVTLENFVRYVVEHENALRLSFESLDHNKDGYIDAEEMIVALKNLGVCIDTVEARRLIRKMDKANSLTISWNEWREFLLLHPSANLHDIVNYWRHVVSMDIGEPAGMPEDFSEAELKTGVWWRHLVAGGVAGAMSRTCTAPLDRLKLILMVHGSRQNNLGIISGFQGMLREGGAASLWRGNGINVLKIAPESALKFMAYEQIKRLMKRTGSQELGMHERFVAGSAAGVFSQTAIYPLEVLKTRLALRRTGQYTGILNCAVHIYRTEGARCFMRGYYTNILGIIPYAGIDLCVYEGGPLTKSKHSLKIKQMQKTSTELKDMFLFYGPSLGEEGYHTSTDPGVLVLLTCGILSSTCGQLASYPLALVRTKLQANVSLSTREQTMTGLFRSILEREGPVGLYRGIVPNFLKVAPAVSISYVVYEKVRKMLGVEMS